MVDAQGATSEPGAGVPAALRSVVEGLRSNSSVTDVATNPVLSAAECEEILSGLSPDGWGDMTVQARGPGADAPFRSRRMERVRRGKIRPVPGGADGPLATRIGHRVLEVNRDVYRFRVVGLERSMRVLWYGSEERGEYVTHRDLGPSVPLRKLSFSLLLSDPGSYEGGDLCFGAPFPLARERGVLTVFPSFMEHSVSPVTAGDRYAIVGFVLGPTFT